MMAAILDSAILVFPLKLTNTCQDWFPPFKQKKHHSHFPPHHLHKKLHSFILTPLDDGSHLEFCLLDSTIFNKKTSFIHSDSIWWWQPSWILPSWIQPICTKKTSLIHSDSNWWWQPSWILPCWIQPQPSWNQTPCYLLSDSLKNTLTLLWLWLKLIQSG